MLVRGEPRAIVQLIVGAATFVIHVGFIDVTARSGGLFGLLSMGIVGALLVERRRVAYLAGTGVALAAVAYWWNVGDSAPATRASEAVSPALAYLLTATLVICLRVGLERESAAHRDAAAALSASEDRFRRAFEVAAAGVALVSIPDGRFLQVNQAGCDLLGYTETELLGMNVQDVTHPDDREESLKRFRMVALGEHASSRITVRYVRSDGTTARALISAALVKDSDGRPSHMVAHAVDTTELHATQQRLTDLVNSKDQLISSVSHEIRTPLTAVLGYAELLRERWAGPPTAEQVEMIDDIVAQATALANIVDDLLVAARAETGQLHVSREAVDLRAEVAAVVENLGRQSHTAHIRLCGSGVYALGDPARVRQILRNVISNALRYGGDAVQVVLSVHSDQCCVVVADNGTGIPEDQRELVFAAYERADPAKGLTPAIGLGLTVARALARLMDGDLVYKYENGQSLFDLSLPLAPGADIGMEHAAPGSVPGSREAPA